MGAHHMGGVVQLVHRRSARWYPPSVNLLATTLSNAVPTACDGSGAARVCVCALWCGVRGAGCGEAGAQNLGEPRASEVKRQSKRTPKDTSKDQTNTHVHRASSLTELPHPGGRHDDLEQR